MTAHRLIKALALTLCLSLVPVLAHTERDYPHNTRYGIECLSCHFVYGSEDPPEWAEHVPLDIDDTPYNTLCWSCHDNMKAAFKNTHSSLQTDDDYGDWSIQCMTCHYPHRQEQLQYYGSEGYIYNRVSTDVQAGVPGPLYSLLTDSQASWTANQFKGMLLIPNTDLDYPFSYNYLIKENDGTTIKVRGSIPVGTDVNAGDPYAVIYGKLISDVIDAPDRPTCSVVDNEYVCADTVAKTVKFLGPTGSNSYADGDGTYDGVCEVCHTMTSYHRRGASGDHTHNMSTRCMDCHDHLEGFVADCGSCHGAPPVDAGTLVDLDPGTTGSITAGAHGKHVNIKSFACKTCHVNSVGKGATHNNALTITMGFSLFEGAYLGGSYDGQSGVLYNSSDPGNTSVSDGGTLTCSSLYCHSNANPFDKANQYKTPVWTGSTTCTSCHDTGGDTTGLSGRHGKHTDNDTYAFPCEKCHNQTAAGSSSIKNEPYHVNNTKDVIFSAGGTYTAFDSPCAGTYCHSDAVGGSPNMPVEWDDPESPGDAPCYLCHSGRSADDNTTNCTSIGGTWDAVSESCTFPDQASCESNNGVWDDVNGCFTILTMRSNGHARLASNKWIRSYPCAFCHDDTTDLSSNIEDYSKHVNEVRDIVMSPQWYLFSGDSPSYDPDTKVCDNFYCHSDGTTVAPDVRPYPWDGSPKGCAACHGHEPGTCTQCHEDITEWSSGEEWKSAMPMYTSTGAGTDKANTHMRHLMTDFTCEDCHADTILGGGCTSEGCHDSGGIPPGNMNEFGHVDPVYHINKTKDITFAGGGTYDKIEKKCSNTACHTGSDPQWGDSVNNLVLCFECHGTTGDDVDDYGSFNDVRARINMNQWQDTGHGRPAASGNYASGNPPADFPGNPCWYCHDNEILHKDDTNPFRLKMHDQFSRRFEKECVYCHMEGLDSECMECHNDAESLAPQLTDITDPPYSQDHSGYTDGLTSCVSTCHVTDEERHDTGAGLWTADEKADVQNQYMMMGVCLKCHDDGGEDLNSNGIGDRCEDCHTGPQYKLGYDPGTGFVTATSNATSTHFGFKHYAAYESEGKWKGGKFCWDCHDPHGDSNIFMIHDKVATETDGTFGIPVERRDVTFTRKLTGLDYVDLSPPYEGICNVCHSDPGQHYRYDYGDGHNAGRICTNCHEHRFSDSHASGQTCNTCHQNKPIPRHTAFSLPRDCTKCHTGVVGSRMDIMGQLQSNSHHIQGVTITNRHCYACHWEATSIGLVNLDEVEPGRIAHQGFNYKTYESVADGPVDLVMWGPGVRPSVYLLTDSDTVKHNGTKYTCVRSNTSSALSEPGVGDDWALYWRDDGTAAGTEADWALSTDYSAQTARTFTAAKVGTVDERTEVAKVTDHCLGCHSDQNNDIEPFGVADPDFSDCKTPNQYAWDRTSIRARYRQTGTTTWGKYTGEANAAKKNITKAFSAHGNAVNNQGGWDASTGYDGTTPDTRNGSQNVQCFDCHSSHGSKTTGITSSYRTFNNTYNGANLKETQAGKGGYSMTYKAAANTDPGAVNPYNAGAAQCFDCHETQTSGSMPWGYNSTFGATEPIMGYKDTSYFGLGTKGSTARYSYRSSQPILGGHLSASSDLKGIDGVPGTGDEAQGTINGLCTPCHDPHGVSPTLGSNQEYAVPLLKGTWMTSPYKEDAPPTGSSTGRRGSRSNKYPLNTPYVYIDQRTFANNARISEDDTKFAGLCLRCHPKDNLTDGVPGGSWKTLDRIHETVNGWGANAMHSYPCSKCHQPHNSALPRLLQTNCLDYNHRGRVQSGGQAGYNNGRGSFPKGTQGSNVRVNCHPTGSAWPDNYWNSVSPW